MDKAVISLNHDWQLPPPDLALVGDQIHIWRVSLDQPSWHVNDLARKLSWDELARAERFRFERDRRRFVVGRGMLRMILSQYLGTDPHHVRFRYGERGKPYLADEFVGSTLRFNLAHSHEMALYAFTLGREVGIDIEYVQPLPDAKEIATRFFSAYESAEFCSLPESQELQAFYNCWTRKEAYLKATGDGLARPLDQFDVSLAPGDPAKLIRVAGDSQEVSRWSLRALAPAPGYVAAVVVEGQRGSLACWQCPDWIGQ
jgi:4'-phosphopantetheinyl transferase